MRWSDYHRCRKYRRKKYRRGFNDRWANLYWRYHFKLYGKHEPLWDIINEGIVWPQKGKKK